MKGTIVRRIKSFCLFILIISIVFQSPIVVKAKTLEEREWDYSVSYGPYQSYDGNYRFSFIDDFRAGIYGCEGGVELNWYIGNQKTVVIPSVISGSTSATPVPASNRQVAIIGANSFAGCADIEKVSVGSNIVYIDYGAFRDCTNLKEVYFPDNVGSYFNIASYMFSNCESLKNITIPEGVKEVKDCSFENCSSLSEVTIPSSVKYIDYGAFNGCNNIENVYYNGTKEQWDEISISSNNECLKNAKINYLKSEEETTIIETTTIQYGTNCSTFGNEIDGKVGTTIETLLVLDSGKYEIDDLDVQSLDTNIVEILSIDNDAGDYITLENEKKAIVRLKLKEEGNTNITVTAPDETSITVSIEVTKNVYEIKLYSEVAALVLGKGKAIGAAVQLEKNGEVIEDFASFSVISSNTNIVTIDNARNESDGTYFNINGVNEGTAKLTITELNTGTIYSSTVHVNSGIITYNAEALPKYYNRDYEYNGYIGGMFIDNFYSYKKNDEMMEVSFNVYNTMNIVGSVDVYDANGIIYDTAEIDRFDGSFVTSLKDTLKSGIWLFADLFNGNLLTYKQASYSKKTEINIEVPVGGHIEITNDPTYSNTCAIYNSTEFIVNSILIFGDVMDIKADAETKNEISRKAADNVAKKFVKAYVAAMEGDATKDKIVNLGREFSEQLSEKALEGVMKSSIEGDLASFVDEGKAILKDCDIDLEKIIIQSAGDLGISIAESVLREAMGPFGEALSGMFTVSQYADYTTFFVNLCKTHEVHSLNIYFDGENGCLNDNGVSIKSSDDNYSLAGDNFVMHSIVLSNTNDLTSAMKSSLDKISNDYIVRNIYLERDGKISQPGQNVQVTIPIPNEYDPSKCKLYWVQDDGTLSEMTSTISDGYISFNTNHFSYYAIVQIKGEEISENIVKGECGDEVAWELNLDTGKLIISGSGTMKDYTSSSQVPWASYRAYIKSVEVQNGVTSIGDYAFYYCFYLTDVALPWSITRIGEVAFYRCQKLTNISIPNNVKSIGGQAFELCVVLKSITIPSEVERIGKFAFSSCLSLEEIDVDAENKYFSSVSGNLYNKDETVLIQYAIGKKDTKFVLPSSVEVVEEMAAISGKYLKNLIVPEGVKTIKTCAFQECIMLEDVILPESLETIGNQAFYKCNNLNSVIIKSSNCIIDGGTGVFPNKVAIIGYSGSTAQKHANTYLLKFVEISDDIYETILNDDVAPTALISSTNNLATSQEVIITLADNVEISGCYWGKDSNYLNNPYTVTSAGEIIKTVLNSGTYYLVAKDISGNVSQTYSITFFKTSFDFRGGNGKPNYTINESGKGFNLPTPTKSGYNFDKWYDTEYAIGYSANDFYIPEKNATYYAQWDKEPQVMLNYYGIYSIEIGEDFELEAYTIPENQTVTWISSNPEVAMVENGLVTGKRKGNVNISAVLEYNGVSYSADIDFIIECNNHIWDEGKNILESSCSDVGIRQYNCQLCGETCYEELDKLSHHYIQSIIKEATVNSEGTLKFTCDKCGNSYTEIIPKLDCDNGTREETTNEKQTLYQEEMPFEGETSTTKNETQTMETTVKEETTTNKLTNNLIITTNNIKEGSVVVTTTRNGNETVVNSKTTKIKKIVKKRKSLKVTWKKKSGINGYQLQYSTSKKFKKAKKITIKKSKTTITIKKLKTKKKYYVRIRTYITVDGNKVWSKWSTAKVKKTK